MGYIAEIPARVAGIPCRIGLTSFHHQPPCRGSPWQCDNDMDFHGYTDCEWRVLDRRGRLAEWLERKVTKEEEARIEGEILTHMRQEAAERRAKAAIEQYEASRDGW